MDTLHFHPYGPPCVGKSILAAVVFSELKIRGVNAEIVTEYAKELAWRGEMTPERQVLVTIEQIRREETLRGRVDVVVTDSPPLLGVAYATASQRETLRQAVLDVTSSWKRHSVMLTLDIAESRYRPEGRNENHAQSRAKGVEIARIVREAGINAEHIAMSDGPEQHRALGARLAQDIIKQLERPSVSRSLSRRIPPFSTLIAESP